MLPSFAARRCAATVFGLALLCLAAMSSDVYAAPIGFTAKYEPESGNFVPPKFTITNTSSAGIDITQLSISLTTPNLQFDPAGGAGIGNSSSFAFAFTTDTGAAGSASINSGGADGSQSLVLNVSGFGPGDVLTFTIDVDRQAQDQVNANHFAGATIAARFAGAFVGSPLISTPASYVQEGNVAVTSFSGDVTPVGGNPTPVPEPASLALFGAFAATAGVVGWRRRRAS